MIFSCVQMPLRVSRWQELTVVGTGFMMDACEFYTWM